MSGFSTSRVCTVRMGVDTDRYLASEGAIAQAVNPAAIFISSRLLQLPRRAQALVLAHEMAHIEQLKRRGNDPERLLEEEAWEAARFRLEGRPFAIRGRACGRLNAAAIIQAGAHPHAETWYRLGQNEPIGNKLQIRVDSVHVVRGMTLESILDKMIELKGTKEFVIVSHGNKSGLALPVSNGSPAGVEEDTVRTLAKDYSSVADGPAGKTTLPPISDEGVVRLTALSDVGLIHRIRDKMSSVRAMGIKHIAFRACNVGGSTDTLRSFKDFFRAASISAPLVPDSYGTFEPGTPAASAELERWMKQLRLKGYFMLVQDGVAFGTHKVRTTLYLIACRPTNKDVLLPWVKKHILDGYSSGVLVYHALFNDHSDHSVYFVRDEEFKTNIVYYT